MLTIETKHNEVCMMVEDDGEGIPKDRREEVFVPFSRLDQSRTSKTGGFGLGLAITQAAVNRSGWCIEVEESRFSGAQFNFRIPYQGQLEVTDL